jgi:hypothetical protein
VIAHEYFGVDIDIVWGVIQMQIPLLEKHMTNWYLFLGNKAQGGKKIEGEKPASTSYWRRIFV